MPARVAATELLASPVRRRIVDHLANLSGNLDANPGNDGDAGRTAAQLGELLGLHVTTARFHLDQLERAGLLESRFERGGVGRPRKVYAIRRGDLRAAAEARGMRHIAELMAQAWHDGPQAVDPESAGAQWGRAHALESIGAEAPAPPAGTPGQWLAKVGQMVDVLTEWGYTPQVATTDDGHTAEVFLHQCPFLSLAKDHPDVVCGLHRGLIKGSMAALGEPGATVGLEPFVAPSLCVAHVSTTATFGKRPPPAQPPPTEDVR